MGLWKSTDLGVVGHDESRVLVRIKGWTRRTGLLRGSREQGSSWEFTLEGGSEFSVFCGVKMSKFDFEKAVAWWGTLQPITSPLIH